MTDQDMKKILSIAFWPVGIWIWIMMHVLVFLWLIFRLIFVRSSFNKALIMHEWEELRSLDKLLHPYFFLK